MFNTFYNAVEGDMDGLMISDRDAGLVSAATLPKYTDAGLFHAFCLQHLARNLRAATNLRFGQGTPAGAAFYRVACADTREEWSKNWNSLKDEYPAAAQYLEALPASKYTMLFCPKARYKILTNNASEVS